MKASELIEQLQTLIQEHGDLNVYLTDWSEEYNKPGESVSVEYSFGKFVIDAR